MTLPKALQDLDWSKGGGLLPAIVQHAVSGEVLMLGYMNEAALAATMETRRVTFFSRSRQCLWQKGETSGNTLTLVSVTPDCDADTLLVQALPAGPVCHQGTRTCFAGAPAPALAFLADLDALIAARKDADPETSYTAKLLQGPLPRAAQKVGEEGVEVALAATCEDDGALAGESADLLYHLMVLLRARGLSLADAVAVLQKRRGLAP